MIAVTGATGHLGRLAIEALLKSVAASEIVAVVRTPSKAEDLKAKGVVVRQGDYDAPASLEAAFAGIDKLLLISSSEVGKRLPQHKAAIDAAKAAGVKLIAYTSILRADTSPLGLAVEHKATEALLKDSGVPHVILRNSWYNENYVGSMHAALQFGGYAGSAGNGKIAAASRKDYAEAAAAVLTSSENQAGKVYELAGDTAFTMSELAAETAKLAGKPVGYNDLPEEAYKGVLVGAGLPEGFAALLADSDVGASKGGLFDDSHTLSKLIGRPTTPMLETLAAALKG
ncbi:SDR family oxidoreductase [Oryzibacter oryziterrae]|uniref:SDR family oxidoreductase n=1 Tax=Oryzibacter oryziterrae TaxID=2766474 RepID=UPI001F416A5C|nr:SDR family oxidoreductase [Oryzibacter oryziterrae]